MNTPFQNFITNLEYAATILDIGPNLLKKLSTPNHIHTENIEVTLESWESKIFSAYRVQHSNARWPYKWWIRFHPDADIDEVKALASIMSIKTAVVNIPLWWAKWGVQCDTKRFTKKDIEHVARSWARVMYDYIGQDKDIPAPDVYTNSEVMAYILDEYERISRKSEPWMITGKPIALGWSKWRDIATAQWWVYVLEELIQIKWLDKSNLRVAIQWFGNAGYNIASILHSLDYKIVALSDSSGWIYSSSWLDPHEIHKLKLQNWSIKAIYFDWNVCDTKRMIEDNAIFMSNEEIIECNCDILIPATLDNQIRKDNAQVVKASIILELANWPTTPEADSILERAWVTVIPDVLANAWWVTVSYFEWIQNRMHYYWSLWEIKDKLKTIMVEAFKEVWAISLSKDLSLRKSAFVLGVQRIVEAEKFRWI